MRVGVGGALAVALALLLACACTDPVHSDRVDALGGELPGTHPGPDHRPGQPCTYCHGGQGPAGPVFDLAGTVFLEPLGDAFGVEGAEVELMDRTGKIVGAGTNRSGNFFFRDGQLGLEFPLRTRIRYGGGDFIEMTTPIFRARSCGECHSGAGPDSVPRIFVQGTP